MLSSTKAVKRFECKTNEIKFVKSNLKYLRNVNYSQYDLLNLYFKNLYTIFITKIDVLSRKLCYIYIYSLTLNVLVDIEVCITGLLGNIVEAYLTKMIKGLVKTFVSNNKYPVVQKCLGLI